MALLFVPWDPWLINKRKWQKGIIKIEKLGWFGLGGGRRKNPKIALAHPINHKSPLAHQAKQGKKSTPPFNSQHAP